MNDSGKLTALLAAAALSGLMAGASKAAPATEVGKTKLLIAQANPGTPGPKVYKPKNHNGNACHGKNACRGKGGCFSGDNGCKGKNSCKGKGGCGTGGTGDKSKGK